MIPAAFDYVRPSSLDEALEYIGTISDAKLLAGGHSLIPMMKLRLATPAVLVDLGAVPGLSGITHEGGTFTIGALTTHAQLATSEALRSAAPALWDAACALGDPQVRNRGTIGGACAHGDPSADYPAVMLALDAEFTLRGKGGERRVRAGEFFTGMFETALEPAEIVTAIRFAEAPASAYVKLEHPASHYAIVGAAACLQLGAGTISSARIALTGLGDVAQRAAGVEKALAGCNITDPDALKAACARAAHGFDVRSDIQASAAYRSAMADVFALRAVQAAANR